MDCAAVCGEGGDIGPGFGQCIDDRCGAVSAWDFSEHGNAAGGADYGGGFVRMEAKNILDESAIHADAKTFHKIMDWMDRPATKTEISGMRRLLKTIIVPLPNDLAAIRQVCLLLA